MEGVGNSKDGYSPIQEQLANSNGSQCGFCSPGWVMQMYSLLTNNPNPTEQEVEDHFDGNLCRCTGYRPILDAFKSFAVDSKEKGNRCKSKCSFVDIEDICSNPNRKKQISNDKKKTKEFLLSAAKNVRDVKIEKYGRQWFHPTSLNDLYSLIVHFQNSFKKLVVGNTSIGIYKETANADIFIYIRDVNELNFTTVNSAGVSIGSAITISKLIEFLENTYKANQTSYTVSHFPVIIKHLYRVANFQVRNSACWAGNLMLAHDYLNFPSDIFTVMLGAGATLSIGDALNPSTVSTVDLLGFLQIDMNTKVILSIQIPFAASQNEKLETYKVSQRHENSHAFVNASLRMTVDPSTNLVTGQPTLAFGGIATHAVRASQTEQFLIGQNITNPNTLTQACNLLATELVPDTRPGYVEYRKQLPLNYFYKFYLSLLPTIPPSLYSAANPYQRPISSGEIFYTTDPIEYPVSEYLPKIDGILQTSGEARYIDDIPVVEGTLHAAFITSTEANAHINTIDFSRALSMPGVYDYVTADDIPGKNDCTTYPGVPEQYKEPVFASSRVTFYGQPIGLILADSAAHAQEAAKNVIITYKNQQPPILTIQEAIEAQSFFPQTNPFTTIDKIVSGDVETGFSQSDHVFQGAVEAPSQYHFHMETQQCIIIPGENGEFVLHSSTQWPYMIQKTVASVLGTSDAKITVGLRRAGGSYGAKITRGTLIACAGAVAAYKTNRPIRVILDLNTNMESVGKRNPYLANYKIGVNSDGKVQALEIMYYNNGGSTVDGTIVSMDMCLTTSDNAYYFPNFSATGTCCRTNLPANTYMRAPGCLPAIYIAEAIMEETANKLGVDPDTFRETNFYTQGQVTPYGTPLTYWNLNTIWDQLQQSSDYQARKQLVAQYNSVNRWTKKGIYITPCKYGIAYGASVYGVLLDVFNDGTIQLSHGGCEVGQGINTKVTQVLALELGCDYNLITVTTTNTQKSPNSASTGGSITSELCSQTVIDAAAIINAQIQPVKAQYPNATWKELVLLARASGATLQASAYYKPPAPSSGPFAYNSYGAAVTETRIDTLTGEVQIERVDIIFDCGTSLNPAIDIGQVEGGFVQGIGQYVTERLLYDSLGRLTTNGTWEYKPPSSKDIPIDFRVTLLADAPNPNGVLSSKASGEPPMTLACCAYFAIKQAIAMARSDSQITTPLVLTAPITPDVIANACQVTASQFTI